MRRETWVQLAPANCNHRIPDAPPGTRETGWLLARGLCAYAALHYVAGHAAAARQMLRFAFWVLLDRAEIRDRGNPDAKAGES